MNTSLKSQQAGYTFFEVIVVMSILTILASVGLSTSLQYQFNERRANVAIREVMMLLEASATFLEGEGRWPDEDNYCYNLINKLDEFGYKPEGLGLKNPWGMDYGFNCRETELGGPVNPKFVKVHAHTPSPRWATYMANALPAAIIRDDGTTVEAAIPRSLMLSSLEDRLVQYATIATNDENEVPKPDCPTGMEPRIFGSFSGLGQSYDSPPIGGAYITVPSEDADSWTVVGEVVTTEGDETPRGNSGYRMQMMVMTMCDGG